MPLYTISVQEGALSPEEMAALAEEITDFHCRMTGLDKAFVKIIFTTCAPSTATGFVGGEAAAAVILTVLIRAGRASDYKRGMLLRTLGHAPTRHRGDRRAGAGGHPGRSELGERNAMEMGQIMPDLDGGAI